MRNNKASLCVTLTLLLTVGLIACDRNSSPEGRMSIKLENLQKEMMDSIRKQNAAMLDSLGKIREDLKKLQQANKQ